MSGRPRLFVVSGPSGTGKGTLIGKVREARPELGLTVSATTRPPRPGEADGVAYHFMDDEEFQRRVDAGEFVEWAWVSKHRYGTLRSEVDKCLARNASVVLEIDVQGALNVRNIYPDAVLIFIEPPSFEELERRLRARGTEDDEAIRVRLETARHEMELAGEYDVRIVNDDIDRATRELLETLHRYES
ncbi:MAG: guanylate kinase [Atopobiaceae bacterium]|nr:guanylate kinase [Atopobiaceae bacterium]MCH4120125.1 guanylate kinase [Atopobiaceae bacterium]MCI1317784.1 guanylate kinase [Atopobiaceae bacterium]MCI1388359.1 guanylate kinase [Atopobiaceae bacterium]MCI1431391.1 guanylate kinase [Atopobiaceae bacterium]